MDFMSFLAGVIVATILVFVMSMRAILKAHKKYVSIVKDESRKAFLTGWNAGWRHGVLKRLPPQVTNEYDRGELGRARTEGLKEYLETQ